MRCAGNAVTPVLFFSTVTGAAVWTALWLIQFVHPGILPHSLVTDPLTWQQHLQLVLKSGIVAASWVGTYFALKHLPLSLGAPIRATSPLFTLLGAVLILGERPDCLETLGILTTLASFVGLSMAGRARGIHFHRNQWFWFLIAGRAVRRGEFALRQISAGHVEIFRAHGAMLVFDLSGGVFRAVRPGLEIALVAAQRISLALEHPRHRPGVVGGGLFLFQRAATSASLVAIVMSLRRGSTLVAFAGGLYFFHEANGWRKLPAVIGILIGIVLTLLG